MPLSSGLSIHDDTKHKGSAKRGAASGVAPLDASAEVIHANSFNPVPSLDVAKAVNTEYQAGSRPILVTISFRAQSGASAGYAMINFRLGSTTGPTSAKMQAGLYQIPAAFTAYFTMTIIVPPHYYYNVDTFIVTTGIIDQVKWHETEL